MRWAWLVLALCACDRVFGLAPTIAIDAQKFDATLDGPYACPAIGTPLQFSSALHQIHQDCEDYTESAVTGRALASCWTGSPPSRLISEGPIGGTLDPLAGMPLTAADFYVNNPRLGVDGDLIFVPTVDLTTVTSTVQVYLRGTSGSWARSNDFPYSAVMVSQATHGPDHHVIYSGGATSPLFEASDATGTWQSIAMFTLASLQLSSVGAVWLSPDGLRMVVVANVINLDRYLAYTDRDALGQPFRPAVRLDAPVALDPFITFDCSQLYFSGLQSVFYAYQR